MAQHPWITFITLGFGAAVGFGWSRLPEGGRRHAAGLALLALLLAGVLVVFDLPTVGLQDALIAPITEPRAAYEHGRIGALSRQAWEAEVCSRIEGPQVAAFQHFGGACKKPKDFYEQRLQDQFALNALLTLGLSLCAAVAILESPRFRFHYALSSAAFLLSLLDLLLLPYAYAKTIRPTPADVVEVHWESAEGKDPKVPALSDTQFFLLFKTKDEVALLVRGGEGANAGEESREDEAARAGTLWVVPRSQVRLFQIVSQEDVLKFVIGEKLAGGPPSTTPRGTLAP